MIWVRRVLIAIAVFVILAFAGFNLFKKQIAMGIFERGAKRNVGIDRSASLPDGLHVYLCGTGSPMADASLAGPCIGVLAFDRVFFFDAGSLCI